MTTGLKEKPFLRTVDPEHLAFAFGVANGLAQEKIASKDPSKSSIVVDFGAEAEEITFTDNPFNRMLLGTTKELKTLIPGDSDEAFAKRAAVMMRVWAMADALSREAISDQVKRRDDSSYFLDSKLVYAFATAPLDGKTGHYKKMAFLKTLQSIVVAPEYLSLTVELPSDLVAETDEAA